jgi:integrase
MKLTQKTVAALTLPKGRSEAIHFDNDIPGLGVRLRTGGPPRWIFQFRVGAKQRRISLGPVSAISVARARELAGELHAKVRLGHDPAATKAEEAARAVETMGATLELYLTHQQARLKPRSWVEIERHLRKHCRQLHGLRLDKIDRRAVAARIAAVTSKSGNTTANRVRASLHAFFAWCLRQGLTDRNPVVGTGRAAEQSRARVLTNVELKAIWAATASGSDYDAVVRLLALTGCRASEIAGLKWSEIIGDQIMLAPERVKNKREFRLPIVPAVRAILDGRPRRPGRDLIFGRRHDRPLNGWTVLKGGLDARIAAAGKPLAHWTHHDLRRTTATRMRELGVTPFAVAAVLNHVSGFKSGIHGVYDKSDDTVAMRQALALWAESLLAIVEDRAPTVVPLRA